MQTLICCIFSVALFVVLLLTEVTPWKLISREEHRTLQVQAQRGQESERAAANGSWMWQSHTNPLNRGAYSSPGRVVYPTSSRSSYGSQ